MHPVKVFVLFIRAPSKKKRGGGSQNHQHLHTRPLINITFAHINLCPISWTFIFRGLRLSFPGFFFFSFSDLLVSESFSRGRDEISNYWIAIVTTIATLGVFLVNEPFILCSLLQAGPTTNSVISPIRKPSKYIIHRFLTRSGLLCPMIAQHFLRNSPENPCYRLLEK